VQRACGRALDHRLVGDVGDVAQQVARVVEHVLGRLAPGEIASCGADVLGRRGVGPHVQDGRSRGRGEGQPPAEGDGVAAGGRAVEADDQIAVHRVLLGSGQVVATERHRPPPARHRQCDAGRVR
jgi:hypothetical protein